ncbi:transglutaminase family protein [Azospirillum sp. TSO22-1]|uniref:transglutaminase-like domain-containing protein n=1 Tax=Azospirillum sp. TSO22-1 TaxID=716789 RepID=UPI000D61DC76|nr:transglutaminase family protein [Azospirillum sp. TSO22-1]PWC31812.1 transglutaminase [Azospirillum sp. TSO22-1]
MDTAARLHLAPAEYVDSDHPAVQAFARAAVGAAATPVEMARRLYAAVRDGIRYNPYVDYGSAATYRASAVLAAGDGYCVGKAALYAAAARSVGLPARLGFADVRNHLATRRLLEAVGTDVFAWHGYVEVLLNGRWVKVTPTFNASLCAKLGVEALDFDGVADALLQPADGGGRRFMEYLADHGLFHDVPAKFLIREMARLYPKLCGGTCGDMEREAEAERTDPDTE